MKKNGLMAVLALGSVGLVHGHDYHIEIQNSSGRHATCSIVNDFNSPQGADFGLDDGQTKKITVDTNNKNHLTITLDAIYDDATMTKEERVNAMKDARKTGKMPKNVTPSQSKPAVYLNIEFKTLQTYTKYYIKYDATKNTYEVSHTKSLAS